LRTGLIAATTSALGEPHECVKWEFMVLHTSPHSQKSDAVPETGVPGTARILKLLHANRRPNRAVLIEEARIVLYERRRRAEIFGKSMFGEPAWDMLLNLYTAQNMTLTVGRLVTLVGKPKTTLLRWAAYLQEKRLIARRDDPKDRRLVWIDLADRGQELLDVYFLPTPNVARNAARRIRL